MSKKPSFRDLTNLSAYLDGALNASACQKLEERLVCDPDLASALDDLRLSRAVLRRTPKRRAPRNFTLSPQMAGVRPPMPRLVPVLNYASLAAVMLFIFSFLGPIGFGGSAAPMQEMVASAPMVMDEADAEPMLEMAAEPAADAAAEEPAAEMTIEEAPAPPAEEPMAEEEAPVTEEPAEGAGANLGETERSTAPTEEGIQAEKNFAETDVPSPTIAPAPVSPDSPVEVAPSSFLTPYQRTLIILLGAFVILSWGIRQATISKWQKAIK